MHALRLIGQAVIDLVCWLPRTIANTVVNRRRRVVKEDDEAERLDRIRNPNKYLGRVNRD